MRIVTESVGIGDFNDGVEDDGPPCFESRGGVDRGLPEPCIQ